VGCVIITGAAGGIGQALVRAFADAGHAVIATDLIASPPKLRAEHYAVCDLRRMVIDEVYALAIVSSIRQSLDGRPLAALVNNAAVQILKSADALSREDWHATLDVNVLAPFFLAQAFLPELASARGTVLNISSIHARLTKPSFVAYATSKAALSAMTRAMAVELGASVRVNAIEPAAISTEMLRAGFAGNLQDYARLENHHPSGAIGNPDDLARFAVAVTATPGCFLNGAVLGFDGGIAGRLHDPA